MKSKIEVGSKITVTTTVEWDGQRVEPGEVGEVVDVDGADALVRFAGRPTMTTMTPGDDCEISTAR